MNYSTCKRLARQLLGPQARVEKVGHCVKIYVPSNEVRTYYGEGDTYLAALNDCFVMESELGTKSSVLDEPKSDSNKSDATEQSGAQE